MHLIGTASMDVCRGVHVLTLKFYLLQYKVFLMGSCIDKYCTVTVETVDLGALQKGDNIYPTEKVENIPLSLNILANIQCNLTFNC